MMCLGTLGLAAAILRRGECWEVVTLWVMEWHFPRASDGVSRVVVVRGTCTVVWLDLGHSCRICLDLTVVDCECLHLDGAFTALGLGNARSKLRLQYRLG